MVRGIFSRTKQARGVNPRPTNVPSARAPNVDSELDAAISALRATPGSLIPEADMLAAKELALDSLGELLDEGKSPRELYRLGDNFFHGDGVQSDRQRALHLWKTAAQPSTNHDAEPDAMYSYAMAVKSGVIDHSENDGGKSAALAFLKQASTELKHAPSMSALGHSFESGDITPASAKEAMHWYGQSARHGGGVAAVYAMGMLQMTGGAGLEANASKAIKLLELAVTAAAKTQSEYTAGTGDKAAAQTSAQALFNAKMALNQLYCADGPNQDWSKGFQVCKDAVDTLRAPHALWVLGNHYYWGKGVDESLEDAARLYEEVCPTLICAVLSPF